MSNEMTSVICRKDVMKQNVMFLLNTLNLDNKTIKLWLPDSLDAQENIVSLEYFRTTEPVTTEESNLMIQKYIAKFGYGGGVVLRKRLYRYAPEDDSTSAPQGNQDRKPITTNEQLMHAHNEFKQRLAKTLCDAINEAINNM